MYNNDPFAPWNDPFKKNDPFAPHNNPMYANDPFKAWNLPITNYSALSTSDRQYYEIDNKDYYLNKLYN